MGLGRATRLYSGQGWIIGFDSGRRAIVESDRAGNRKGLEKDEYQMTTSSRLWKS